MIPTIAVQFQKGKEVATKRRNARRLDFQPAFHVILYHRTKTWELMGAQYNIIPLDYSQTVGQQ